MATIVKIANRYQVQIRRMGEEPIYKPFAEKRTAMAWARKTESEIDQCVFRDSSVAQKTSLKSLLHRYEREILPTKRSQASVSPWDWRMSMAILAGRSAKDCF